MVSGFIKQQHSQFTYIRGSNIPTSVLRRIVCSHMHTHTFLKFNQFTLSLLYSCFGFRLFMILFFAKHVLVATRGNVNYQKRYVHGARRARPRGWSCTGYQPHPERQPAKQRHLQHKQLWRSMKRAARKVIASKAKIFKWHGECKHHQQWY